MSKILPTQERPQDDDEETAIQVGDVEKIAMTTLVEVEQRRSCHYDQLTRDHLVDTRQGTEREQEEESPEEGEATTTETGGFEKWNRRLILAVYLITITILYADLALMAPNLSEIADEFGFNDDERDLKLGGYIALGFFTLSFPAAILIGWLADFCNRSPLYAITVFLGEAACLATYFVQTYSQLFVTRLLTGVSISGSLPVIFSVLGDLYPASQRNAVAAIVTTGTGLGTGIGQALAGFLGPTHGWRFPFLIVSIPGMVCSLLLLCIKDPPRGRKEAARLEFDEVLRSREYQKHNSASHIPRAKNAASSTKEIGDSRLPRHSNHSDNQPQIMQSVDTERRDDSIEIPRSGDRHTISDMESTLLNENESVVENKVSWKTTKDMITTRTVALVFLGAAPGALPFGFGSVFLNDYLAEDRGMSVEEATGVLATFGAGNAVGVISSGIFGHYAYKKDARLPPIIMGTSLILACIPMYFLINWVDGETSVASVAVVALVGGILSVIPVPIERAILTNVTIPTSRGRANSILGIIDDLGKGLGPALVSILIQAFDRPMAFNISLLGWVIGGVISYFMVCYVEGDEEQVQERVRAYIIQEEGLTQSCLHGQEEPAGEGDGIDIANQIEAEE